MSNGNGNGPNLPMKKAELNNGSNSRSAGISVTFLVLVALLIHGSLTRNFVGRNILESFKDNEFVVTAGGAEHSTAKRSDIQLPDWRQAIDCNIYDNMCGSNRQRENRYFAYPFPYGRKINNEHRFHYQPLSEIPEEWKKSLEANINPLDQPPKRPIVYEYPPEASKEEQEKCLENSKTLSWKEQIQKLLESRLKREPTTNMTAFTISDYNYAFDMIHDVFEMNDQIVGFENAFFLVALDEKTVHLACQYGYPVVAWGSAKPEDTTELKHAVANTKFEVSLELIQLGIDFLFYEMDVWFVKSPKEVIAHFHKDEQHDMLASTHQDCPLCLNIGVYSITANERTKEYFELTILLAQESPNTHDQWIMTQLLHTAEQLHRGEEPNKYEGRWDPLPKSNPPPMKHPIYHGFYHTHEIVASERPITTTDTFAVHTLCAGPLKKPHGKKMMAKELGAWYGFQGPNGNAGYYARTGPQRRYLWMDGHLPGSYNTVMNFGFEGDEAGLYHAYGSLRWTMAALLALARRTGRIFVMPKIIVDHGMHFLWTLMDFEPVEEMGIDYRETNFPNNPRSWHSEMEPFQSAARTAMGAIQDVDRESTMYVQFPPNATAGGGEGPVKAWKFKEGISEGNALDAWWALHTALPEIDSAELLLVNPHIISIPFTGKLDQKRRQDQENRDSWSVAEREIIDVYSKLKWCMGDRGDNIFMDRIVGRNTAEWACHGKGVPIE